MGDWQQTVQFCFITFIWHGKKTVCWLLLVLLMSWTLQWMSHAEISAAFRTCRSWAQRQLGGFPLEPSVLYLPTVPESEEIQEWCKWCKSKCVVETEVSYLKGQEIRIYCFNCALGQRLQQSLLWDFHTCSKDGAIQAAQRVGRYTSRQTCPASTLTTNFQLDFVLLYVLCPAGHSHKCRCFLVSCLTVCLHLRQIIVFSVSS